MLFSFNQGAVWDALMLQTARINTLYCSSREEDKPRHCVCIRLSLSLSLHVSLSLSERLMGTFYKLPAFQQQIYFSGLGH